MPKTSRPSRWVPALAVAAVAVAALGTVLASWWAQRHASPALQAQEETHATHPAQRQRVKAPAHPRGLKREAACRDCAEPRALQEDRS